MERTNLTCFACILFSCLFIQLCIIQNFYKKTPLSLYLTYFEGIFPRELKVARTNALSFPFAWVVPLGIRPPRLVLFAVYSAYWCNVCRTPLTWTILHLSHDWQPSWDTLLKGIIWHNYKYLQRLLITDISDVSLKVELNESVTILMIDALFSCKNITYALLPASQI